MDVFTKTIEGSVSKPNCTENRKKKFSVVIAYYEHLIRVEGNTNKIRKKTLSNKFGRWKAGDYARLRYEATSMKQSRKTVKASTKKLMNFASGSQLPPSVEPVCCGASLSALKKMERGVNPIAVVEVLRCFVAKGIAKQIQLESAELFSSKQLGEEFKSGAESIIHATKNNFEKLLFSRDAGVLQIDLKNAFNFIEGSFILNAAVNLKLSLAPLAIYC